MTQLRQQMLDAMVLRGFAERTREAYLSCVAALARHYRRAPDRIATDEIQSYLLHLITEKKLAYATVNQAACAFRFFHEAVLKQPGARFDIPMAKAPKRLPQVLSRDEVVRLFNACTSLRARTLLMTTYAAGLRVSEVCALQVRDIESAPDRMCLKVRQGKGGKPCLLGAGLTRRTATQLCKQLRRQQRVAILAARRRELLPVPYFHLVFTLPHALHGLVGAHSRRMYETLFQAASATLTEFAANPRHLGGEMAFSLVLHTWKQDLGRHVHVHALVAGGALTPTGDWVRPKRGFLFPVKALSKVFRGKFVAALTVLRAAGSLPAVSRDTDWQALKTALFAHGWVVYAKAPLGGPEQVLEYLSRYTHRVAISNERIVGVGEKDVSFRVRADATTGKKRTVHLPGTVFIERFLLHVLPPGFKRIRHYGLLASRHKHLRLNQARAVLDVPIPDPAVIEPVAAFMQRVAGIEWNACTHCGKGRFVVTASIASMRAPNATSRGPPCLQ